MNPLALLEDPLRAILEFLHDPINLTYGWCIVVLTVMVRTAMLPLVVKQYQSMRAMQMVAPQLKELQKKYKGNRQKLNEELMAFYKENEINPFASCLPLVAQIPIFIALYYVLKNFAKNASGGDLSFMWLVPNVTEQLTDIGWGAFILVAIYGLSQLLSTELSATPNMPPSQRRMMRFIPLVVVLFVFQFPVPAGLVIYWMTTNLWTCGQQLVMRHRIGLHLADPAEVAKFEETQKKRGSRTPPKEAVAVVEAPAEPEAGTGGRRPPRNRRRRGAQAQPDAEAQVAAPDTDGAVVPEPEAETPEVAEVPQAADAPEGVEAPEPTEAPEATTAPEPETAEAATSPANGARGNGRSGGAGTPRRQPRPKGAAKGSRPAQPSRSKKKKR